MKRDREGNSIPLVNRGVISYHHTHGINGVTGHFRENTDLKLVGNYNAIWPREAVLDFLRGLVSPAVEAEEFSF